MNRKGGVKAIVGSLMAVAVVVGLVFMLVVGVGVGTYFSQNPLPVDPVDVGDEVDQDQEGNGTLGGGGSGGGTDSNPIASMSAFQTLYWETYLDNFVVSDGRVISTIPSFSCVDVSSGEIGCGTDTSSEGVSKTIWLAAAFEDRDVFDQEIDYVLSCMQHPNGNYLMWNRDEDCNDAAPGGSNSANDADQFLVDALRIAIEENGWTHSNGVDLRNLQREIMDGMKAAVVSDWLTHCTTYIAGDTPPVHECEPRGFVGYNSLKTINYMSSIDSFWAPVYDEVKRVSINAVEPTGVYETYYPLTDTYANSGADQRGSMERIWVLMHLIEDGSPDAWEAAKPLYETARNDFLSRYASGSTEICKNLRVGEGCSYEVPEQTVYGFWLRAASARADYGSDVRDDQFRDALIETVKVKVRYAGSVPMLVDDWQYSQTVLQEALWKAQLSGGDVGGLIA